MARLCMEFFLNYFYQTTETYFFCRVSKKKKKFVLEGLPTKCPYFDLKHIMYYRPDAVYARIKHVEIVILTISRSS